MMTAIMPIQDIISRLIVACRDAEEGFEIAASAIASQPLRTELLQYSGQRAEFIADLEQALEELGEMPHTRGSFAGVVQRGWMQIAKALSHNEQSILAACVRGEDAALVTYRDAVSSPLPSTLGALIAAQYQAIRRVHDRIKALRIVAARN